MKETIYALCIKQGAPFYVGRTKHPAQRLQEHKYASKAGTETKYQFIRMLEEDGQEWEMLVLEEVDETSLNYEDYWVYTLIMEGYSLTNMKAGDSMQAAEQDAMLELQGQKRTFQNAETFLFARDLEIEMAKARAATAKLNAKILKKEERINDDRDVSRHRFADETKKEIAEREMSPAMRAMIERRSKK